MIKTPEPATLASKLREIVSRIDAVLSKRENIRDLMIRKSREIIRYSNWTINAILRNALEDAKRYISQIDEGVKEFLNYARQDDRLYHSGLVDSTLAEYVEAKVLYSMVAEARLPTPEELGVSEVPYLQGLGDVIGELRRLALDYLRVDEYATAERILTLMEVIYNELRVLEYPESLIPGVRHKIDVARRLIDDTKALLIEVKGRRELLEKLGPVEQRSKNT